MNGSVIQLASNLQTHSSTVEGSVKGVKERVNDLRDRVEAFKSHPPAIGKVCSTYTAYCYYAHYTMYAIV